MASLSSRDIESIKPWVRKTVKETLGIEDETIVAVAFDCIERKMPEKDASDALSSFLEEKTPRFVSKLFRKLDEVLSAKRVGASATALNLATAASAKKKRDITSIFGDEEDEDEAEAKKPKSMSQTSPTSQKPAAFPSSSAKLEEPVRQTPIASIPVPVRTPIPAAIPAAPKGGLLGAVGAGVPSPAQFAAMLASLQGKSGATAAAPKPTAAIPTPIAPVKAEPQEDGPGPLVAPAPVMSAEERKAEIQRKIQEQIKKLEAEKKIVPIFAPAPSAASVTLPMPTLVSPTGMPGLVPGPGGIGLMPNPLLSAVKREQPMPNKPMALRINEKGQVVDEQGNILDANLGPVKTIKANINKDNKERFEKFKVDKVAPDIKESKNFDPRLKAPVATGRRKREIRFVEKGRYERMAERIRSKIIGEQIAEAAKASSATDIFAGIGLQDNGPKDILADMPVPIEPDLAAAFRKEDQTHYTPETEWWDDPFLPTRSYVDLEGESPQIRDRRISFYVEHPVPIQPPHEAPMPGPIPLPLTKKERKKLRTQRRLARSKELQEKIRLGLAPKPEPKVKLSNMMRAITTDAVQDPTKIEQMVREQERQRAKMHDAMNQARKLTAEQRKEKKEKKLFGDRTGETIAAVFRVNDLSNPSNKYKVDINATWNKLTGCVITSIGLNVVIVEGVRKSIKRYTKLMLNRIDWSAKATPRDGQGSSSPSKMDEDDPEEEEEENEEAQAPVVAGKMSKDKKCILIWQGVIKTNAFKDFRFFQFQNEISARKHLSDKGVEHYWDQCKTFRDPTDDLLAI